MTTLTDNFMTDSFMEVCGRRFSLGSTFGPFDIEHIARRLANECRFSGDTFLHYSVAEHSVHLTRWARRQGVDAPDELRAFLLHDASEAYLRDIPAPLKALLPDYCALEDRLMSAIADHFRFAWPLPAVVKMADKRILRDEREQALPPSDLVWCCDALEPLGVEIEFLTPEKAREEFINEYMKIRCIL